MDVSLTVNKVKSLIKLDCEIKEKQSPKMNPSNLDSSPVTGCMISHKSHTLHDNSWDMRQSRISRTQQTHSLVGSTFKCFPSF